MSTPDTRVRVGFVGVGTMGQAAHLRNYASLSEDCEVVACAELSAPLRKAAARRYGIARAYASGAELLAHERVDALVAAQPFERHGQIVPELLAAGVPIFTEKPIASSVATGERLVAAVAASGTWLMVGYHKRCDPATVHAKAAMDGFRQSGELGRLRYLRLTMPPGDWIAGGFNDVLPETWRRDNAALTLDPPPADMDPATCQEYNTFVNYYVHQINLLRHLLGEPYRVSYADPARVLLVAHSASGVPCTIEMAPYHTSLDWQEMALAGFDRGYVKLSLPAPLVHHLPGRVEILRDPGHGVTPTVTIPHLPPEHAMRAQARAFLRAVRGESPAPCLAPEALEDLRVAREYIRLLERQKVEGRR